MDQNKFQEYLQKRYYPETKWYNQKSLYNQNRYKTLQVALIVLSALTPILILIDFRVPNPKIIPVATSVLVAILSATLKTFKFEENWLNYRTTCETLTKEIFFYQAKLHEYKDVADPEGMFVERVEALISRENTLWLSTAKQPREKRAQSSES